MTTHQGPLQQLFVTGLTNLHAVEKQALSIITPQAARLEHYPEVAAYRSAMVMAEGGGFAQAEGLLRQSLREQESMAQWIGESLPMVTRRYASLHAGQGAMTAKV